MKHIQTLVISLVILFPSISVEAQDRWSFEVHSGSAFATQDLGDANLGTGFGFEGTVAYRFMPHLGAYAGWGWNQFSADQSFAGNDIDFEETGYTFGLQFIHPIAESRFNYLFRLGGIYNHIEVENNDGNIIADSKHGLGFQVETGLAITLGDHWSLIPSVRYRYLSREIKLGSVNTAANLNYISIGVGLAWSF